MSQQRTMDRFMPLFLAAGKRFSIEEISLLHTKFGLVANQVRTITAGTAAPSGGSDGDIYLRYT